MQDIPFPNKSLNEILFSGLPTEGAVYLVQDPGTAGSNTFTIISHQQAIKWGQNLFKGLDLPEKEAFDWFCAFHQPMRIR